MLAETAGVRPWAEPHPCVSPRRRVVDLHERVRTQPYNPGPNPITLTLTDAFRAVIT